jgi:hypothetical protein
MLFHYISSPAAFSTWMLHCSIQHKNCVPNTQLQTAFPNGTVAWVKCGPYIHNCVTKMVLKMQPTAATYWK